ncbi:hypothetical protein KUG85_10800 [Nitratireductor sp. L1-7-SE]|uniref:Uncharacterized protein n=1 Tax=Nitratireductor rhodophyticola TaxID=2854036 RepID=A0ABS7RAQ0_9HYPH|nr:hypothetical protein [Nitratireductor rhodophyticola]MBY8918004.1 hypothetical protein [Nitratireductor rhodophyticola]MBY8921187.1 hypothetical protein [Nitratireductor rhodophyticola]
MSTKRRHSSGGRPRQPVPNTLPDDLYDYSSDPTPRVSPRRGRPPHIFDVERLPVIDDWPEDVPITEAEIQVFERWFADVFDELFGSVDLPDDLKILSRDDKDRP